MSLASVIISSIIIGIISLGAFQSAGFMLDVQQEREQNANQQIIKNAALASYELTGLLSDDLSQIMSASNTSYDLTALKDLSGSGFIVLNNGGAPFTYNGSIMRLAIVAPFLNGMQSSIDSGVFVLRAGEQVLFVSQYDIEQTNREKNLVMIARCNSALSAYTIVEGGSPSSLYDLISSGYLSGRDIIDTYGSALTLNGGVCESVNI